MKTIVQLTEEYDAWNKAQGLSLGSADEHLFDERLTHAQRKWLAGFCTRWDRAQALDDCIEQAKREVTADVLADLVPFDVASFSALHDHVDANEYGGLCDGEFDPSTDTGIEFANALQTAVDAWIKSGALLTVRSELEAVTA